MINFEIDPRILQKNLPQGTELDYFSGKTYVSLVGFSFKNTKIKSLSIPFHKNFEEINLRYYVRRKIGNEWRKGVVFLSEIAQKAAVSFLARKLYNENYMRMEMKSEVRENYICYKWKNKMKWNSMELTVTGDPKYPSNNSFEYFIVENYWGYSKNKKNEKRFNGKIHPFCLNS